jgi:hypothetical protein
MTLAMIDQPSPLATLAKWEQHLDRVRALPDNATSGVGWWGVYGIGCAVGIGVACCISWGGCRYC